MRLSRIFKSTLLILALLISIVPVSAFAGTTTYQVVTEIPVYMNSYNAANKTNAVTTYSAGTYYIFNQYNSMINISTSTTDPGGWINPSQNTGSGSTPGNPPSSSTMYTTDYLNLRSGPSTSNSILLTMPSGAEVTVIGTSGSWKNVTYGGYTGWAHGDYLETAGSTTPDPPSSGDTMYTTDYLNLRTGPSTGYSIILVMPSGSEVDVIDYSGNWKKVVYGSYTGWASADYLSTYSQPDPDPDPDPTPSGKLIALTFDDGPSAYTSTLLNGLAAYGAEATFFVLGSNVSYRSSLIARMANEGHEIGNHSYSHSDFTTMSYGDIEYEVDLTDELIMDITGVRPRLIRTPYGSVNSTVRSAVGKPIILWNGDSRDWETRSASAVESYLLNYAEDGDILLFHDSHGTTVEGVLDALPTLVARGFTFVTVSDLFRLRGYSLSSGSVYYSAP